MEEVRARLAALEQPDRSVASSGAGRVVLDAGRRPPKVFLQGFTLGVPPAAEIELEKTESGTAIVLRLMWGPLPAPFPRAATAIGVLLATALLGAAGPSVAAVLGALCLAGLPIAALERQRRGERRIQADLREALGSDAFSPEADSARSANLRATAHRS